MAPGVPDGDPAPRDGALSVQRRAGLGSRPFGVYVHVPFCATRCGYCDFNTYTPAELRSGLPSGTGATAGVGTADYLDAVMTELELATRTLGPDCPAADTIFIGGGTPTMLTDQELTRLLRGTRAAIGMNEPAEITVEANPDTVTVTRARNLAEAGVTRISLGMQSSVPAVLTTLERTHRPDSVARAVQAARQAGLAVSLDLIYGAPGESVADWCASLHSALSLNPDHVSAYALVVENGTRLAARVRRAEVAPPDPDDQATKYEIADDMLAAAGFAWYEVSNWSRNPSAMCRHNQGYWRGANWWGIGPGAHSHVGGVRWWNLRQPYQYIERLRHGRSPAQAREELDDEQRYDEHVLLGIRLSDGLPVTSLRAPALAAIPNLTADGLIQPAPLCSGDDERVVLTRRGRLLADLVVRRLLGY